jgi:hypothetical protein
LPAKPTWWARLGEIVATLEMSEAVVMDRSAAEKLFQVGPRRAVQLMTLFGAHEAGGAALIERERLLARLREIRGSNTFTEETRRRRRVADELEILQRRRAAEKVRIAVTPEIFNSKVESLPEAVQIRAGHLEIEYGDCEDLLQKLVALSQAAYNDFERFQRLTSPTVGTLIV